MSKTVVDNASGGERIPKVGGNNEFESASGPYVGCKNSLLVASDRGLAPRAAGQDVTTSSTMTAMTVSDTSANATIHEVPDALSLRAAVSRFERKSGAWGNSITKRYLYSCPHTVIRVPTRWPAATESRSQACLHPRAVPARRDLITDNASGGERTRSAGLFVANEHVAAG